MLVLAHLVWAVLQLIRYITITYAANNAIFSSFHSSFPCKWNTHYMANLASIIFICEYSHIVKQKLFELPSSLCALSVARSVFWVFEIYLRLLCNIKLRKLCRIKSSRYNSLVHHDTRGPVPVFFFYLEQFHVFSHFSHLVTSFFFFVAPLCLVRGSK